MPLKILWSKIIGQRHVIAHEYDDLNYAILWRVAVEHVPALIVQLQAILPDPPSDPHPEESKP